MLANWHFTVIVLLQYIDLFITCINVMLGNYYSVDIIPNALLSFQLNWNIGHKPTNHISFCYTYGDFPYYILVYKTIALTYNDCFSRMSFYITIMLLPVTLVLCLILQIIMKLLVWNCKSRILLLNVYVLAVLV